jgi:hypothetical protein
MPSSAEEKEQLEIAKLKMELRYIRRTFIVQVVNIFALVGVGLVVLYFFQRPQIEQMEMTRLANEKQEVAKQVIAAQSIADPGDRRRMILSLAELYPTHQFVLQIARSAIVMAERTVTTADNSEGSRPSPQTSPTPAPLPPAPTPTPTTRPEPGTPPDPDARPGPTSPPSGGSTPQSFPTPAPSPKANSISSKLERLNAELRMYANTREPIPERLLEARNNLLQQRQECFNIYSQYMKLIAQRRILSETYQAEVRGRGETGKSGEGPVAKSIGNQMSELFKETENLVRSYSDACDFELPQ